MRILLDTHALLWALLEPDRLGPRARPAIGDRRNDLLVSAASAWEIATKVRIGKLPDAEHVVQNYGSYLDRLGAVRVAISDQQALFAGALTWSHRDPFDRMLASQSILENVPLITADPVFTDLPTLRTLW